MTFDLSYRVQEQVVVTGTGDVTLGGALLGFQTFASTMANGDTTWYAIVDPTAGAWEVGVGTWNTGNTFSRTTVESSSNSGAHVNFAGNSCQIFQDIPALKAAILNSVLTPSAIPAGTTANLLAASGTAGLAALATISTGLTLSSSNLSIIPATTLALGGVIIGANLSISLGTISLSSSGVAGALGYTPLTNLLASTDIWVGNSSGTAAAVGLSGDGTLANTGSLTISSIGGKGVTLGGSLQTTGGFATTFDITGATEVTFPTSGTLATTGSASGIVHAGISGRVAFYAASGNTISGSADLVETSGSLMLGSSGGNAGNINLFNGTNSFQLLAAASTPAGLSMIMPAASATASGVMTYTGTSVFTLVPSSGPLGTALGGTGLASFTSGSVVYASGTATLASSTLLAQHAPMLGGGAGAAPYTISLGVAGQVLVSNGSTTDSSFASLTKVGGIAVELASTLAPGTYDLGPFPQGGTLVNSYAHVASGGTMTFTAAIGAPGTYTPVTGLTSVAISTAVENTGTATAANTLAAGVHLWVEVANTGTPVGGSIFFGVQVP